MTTNSNPPKIVLVTGASSGIGKCCALDLDARGFHVYAGVRKTEDAEALRSEGSDRLETLILDVTNETHIAAAVTAISAAHGEAGLAGLVNNAGVALGGPTEVLPMTDWTRQFDINLFGQIALTRACLPLLRSAQGRVVNMSSLSGTVATPFLTPYVASKFALEGWTAGLRLELRPWQMWACTIQPGAIQTPMWDKGDASVDVVLAAMSEDEEALYGAPLRKMHEQLARSRRMAAPPEKVARAVRHALTARRPRVRYRVGVDTGMMFFFKWLLPGRAFDWVLRKAGGY